MSLLKREWLHDSPSGYGLDKEGNIARSEEMRRLRCLKVALRFRVAIVRAGRMAVCGQSVGFYSFRF